MDATTSVKAKYEALSGRLNEATLRLWAAVEARSLGRGGVTTVAEASGLSRTTIYAGLRELEIAPGKPASNAFLSGNQKKQAAQLTSALTFLIKSRRKFKIDSAYWFSWKDTDPNGQNCNFCYTIGLFRYAPGLKQKKAWPALVKLTGGQV